MRALLTLAFLGVVGISGGAFAEHEGKGGTARPGTDPQEEAVRSIFAAKCQNCHEGDGKFTDNDIPAPEWREKVLKALNHEKGVRQMPPASKKQLTEVEKQTINQFFNKGKETPTKTADNSCKDDSPKSNPKVVNQIFADRCVTCHGKMSFNPTSVLRPAHNQFLNNDGSLDLSVLGDMSEIQPYQMPKGKSSVGRMLDALMNYTMPPRGTLPVITKSSDSLFPKMGTPHMTEAERQFAINALKQRQKQANCSPKDITVMAFTKGKGKSQTQVSPTFAQAAKACENLGQRVPTRQQLDALKDRAANAVGRQGCVWTETFDFDQSRAGQALRKMLYFQKGGSPAFGWATENYGCKAICVR